MKKVKYVFPLTMSIFEFFLLPIVGQKSFKKNIFNSSLEIMKIKDEKLF